METKRFLGNDMARIFVRVRTELGPDAVIVSTRSLMRENADPLIEVIAAPAGSEAEISVAMQRSIAQGLLARIETSRGLTIGDLEDLAERERDQDAEDGGYAQPAQQFETREWAQGFVPAPPAPAYARAAYEDDWDDASLDTEDALPPFHAPEVAPPPPMEFRPRPKIVTRPRPEVAEPLPQAPAAAELERFEPMPPGVASRLVAAGFSSRAANAVASRHSELTDAEQALGEFLASREAQYPVEGRTAIITIQGAPGSGRTTALMRMALDCADAGRHAVLVAADTSRTGGREQVHAYGEAIGVSVFDAFSPQDLVHAVTRAPKGACIFVDVPAGRWAPPPIPGVQHFAYAAIPAHWNSVVSAAQLAELGESAGTVITFSDLATDLIPALSLLVETGLGLAFLSSGRDVATGIEVADPLTLASGVFTTRTRETTNGRLVATA